MPEHLKVINDQARTYTRRYVRTDTAIDIQRSLQMAHDEPGTLTMIAGIPGAGKSETINHYCATQQNVVYHSMTAGEGKIWDLAVGLMETLSIGTPNSRRMREERHRIAEAVGAETLLIIDEAQYLSNYNPRGGFNYDAYEWLRAMAEEGHFSVTFCGDLALYEAINAVPQLRRRVIRPVIIRSVPKADAIAVARHLGVSDLSMLEALAQVAKRFGGIADVVKVIDHAKRFCTGDDIERTALSAAITDLKLV